MRQVYSLCYDILKYFSKLYFEFILYLGRKFLIFVSYQLNQESTYNRFQHIIFNMISKLTINWIYIWDFFVTGNIVSDIMFIILKLLFDTVFCHLYSLCENLHPSSWLHLINFFMEPPPVILYAAVFNYP